MPTPYGADTKGVLDYVPELNLDPVDAAGMVETFLAVTGPIVVATVNHRLRAITATGHPDAAAVVADARAAAKGLVEMGAASLLQDSRYPELAASRQTDQAYGATLWARFLEALERLGATLDTELERLEESDLSEAVGDLPDISGPPAFFHDAQRW